MIRQISEEDNTNHRDTDGRRRRLSQCLHIETTTWVRDSHELFDYEARHVQRRSYLLRRPARVLRTSAEVEVLPDNFPATTVRAADHLATIRNAASESYVIWPADRAPSSSSSGASTPGIVPKKLWLIVKDLVGGTHKLSEGDMIKLGRYKLRVKQLALTATAPDIRWDEQESTPERLLTPEEAATGQCRICLLDGGTPHDPLVCPCACRGSIEYVHVECLRRWVRGKLGVLDEGQRVATFLRQVFCELCKTPFPSTVPVVQANGVPTKLPVVPLPPVEPPFILLEHVASPQNARGVHILSLGSRKEVKLGRGHESDVRIADVSISRYHATIRFADGNFVLEDHGSKFGTLVSLRKPCGIEQARPLSVQVGRTVLNFSVVDPPFEFHDMVELKCENPPGEEDELQTDAAAVPNTTNNPTPALENNYHHTPAIIGDSTARTSGSNANATGWPPIPENTPGRSVAASVAHAIQGVSHLVTTSLSFGGGATNNNTTAPAAAAQQQSPTNNNQSSSSSAAPTSVVSPLVPPPTTSPRVIDSPENNHRWHNPE